MSKNLCPENNVTLSRFLRFELLDEQSFGGYEE